MNKKQQKAAIRKIYKEQRAALSWEERTQWSNAICRNLHAAAFFQQAKAVYFYYPLENEVNLLPLAQIALLEGKCVGFPKTEGEVINFYQIKALTDFKEGCFHVMEPVSNLRLEEKNPLILIPGLVFDEKKNRMGYGRGYYDKYLACLPRAVKVGVSYEMQLAEEVVVNAFDIPMDYMATEHRIW